MKRIIIPYLLLAASLLAQNTVAQVTLNANGSSDTYALINSVFAPGYDVIESAECIHSSFGRHIAEVFDATLNQYVLYPCHTRQ
jgi:hypothetical protein